jgi:hypothetical protein
MVAGAGLVGVHEHGPATDRERTPAAIAAATSGLRASKCGRQSTNVIHPQSDVESAAREVCAPGVGNEAADAVADST